MTAAATAPVDSRRWRTVDIVVASVLGVAFGVVFWAWGLLWSALDPAFAVYKPAGGVMIGVWMLAAVVGGLVIRKPGAALYTESVAALVSVMIGAHWGLAAILEGVLEGLGGELAFALLAYRSFRLPVAALSGALTALAATVFESFVYYADTSWLAFRLPYILIGTASGLVLAGIGGWLLVRALARAGVLDRFGAGAEQQAG